MTHNPTDAERLVSKARRTARREVATILGRQTASGNLAADRIADAIVRAIGYRDHNAWPSRDAINETIKTLRSEA